MLVAERKEFADRPLAEPEAALLVSLRGWMWC